MKPVFYVIFFTNFVANGVPVDEEVTKLPFTNFDIRFKHYSGYLNASDTVKLHYWWEFCAH